MGNLETEEDLQLRANLICIAATEFDGQLTSPITGIREQQQKKNKKEQDHIQSCNGFFIIYSLPRYYITRVLVDSAAFIAEATLIKFLFVDITAE